MKFKVSLVIIIISILLCCSIVGGAFALYSVNDTLTISFSGIYQEPIKYYLSVDGVKTEIESGVETIAYLKKTSTVAFYKNNDLLTVSYATGSDVTSSKKPAWEFNYLVKLTVPDSGNPTASVVVDKSYYLVGDNNGWSITDNAIKLEANPTNPNELMAKGVSFARNQGFKIRDYEGDYGGVEYASVKAPWIHDKSGNIVLWSAGKYDFYYKKNTDKEKSEVYFEQQGVSYTEIPTYRNANWVTSDGAIFFARDDTNGNFYGVTAITYEGDWNTNVIVYLPNGTTRNNITIYRVNPTSYMTFATFNANAGGQTIWNTASLSKNKTDTGALFY